jgi:GAF domain-containing protein
MLAPMQQRLIATQTFEAAAWIILDDVVALHGAEFGTLQLPVGDHLLLAAHRGFKPPFLKAFQRVSKDDGCVCGQTLRRGSTVVVPDVEQNAEFAPFLLFAREAGYRAVQSTPLLLKDGTLMGLVSTHFSSVHEPTQIEMQILREYSAIAAERLRQLLGGASLEDEAEKMSRKIYRKLRRTSTARRAA